MRAAALLLALLAPPAPLPKQATAPLPPPSVRALLERARQQLAGKDTAGALESLRQARSIAPNSERVLRASADAARAAGALLPTIRHLEALARLHPTVAEYRWLEGSALLRGGDTEAAVAVLTEADRLEPRRPATLVPLARALSGSARFREARSCALRALSLAPDDPEALSTLAEAEEGLDDLGEAEAHARRALDQAAAQPLARLVIGTVRMKQARWSEAREALTQAVAADPDSAKACCQLSQACGRLGDASCARAQLQQCRRNARQRDERVAAARALTGFSPAGSPP